MTVSTKPNSKKPFVVGVAGGSGSGKTYFAQALQKHFGDTLCTIIDQDNFYIDQSQNFDFDGGAVNFDHPDSIDFALLANQVELLKSGQFVKIPIYDFKTHSRSSQVLETHPRPLIIVDGILIFHPDELRRQFDDLIFFDTPENLRFQRRLTRDVHERGREPQGVRNQFLKQVKPMHDQFVEPSKKFAKTVVKESGEFAQIFKQYCENLKKIIST